MFDSLLVADGGEGARRIIRSTRNLGALTVALQPDGVGVDSRYQRGDVTPYYDSLHRKLQGIRTNLWFFAQLLQQSAFVTAYYDTGLTSAVLDDLIPVDK